MINTHTHTPEDEPEFESMLVNVRFAEYVENELRVEGEINNERWFFAGWVGTTLVCNISRRPMCREDFWVWAKKNPKLWFQAEITLEAVGNHEADLPVLMQAIGTLVKDQNKSLKIKFK